MADKYFNGLAQVRVTELLATGAADPSATAKTSTAPKEITADAVYIDGDELEQRGGDALRCTITQEDEPKGYDGELTLSTLDYDLKQAIAGGDLNMSGLSVVGWDFPTSTPGPFKMEIWVPAFNVNTSIEGKPDGYLKITLPFCKGRVGKRTHGDKTFGEDVFSFKARQNPNDGGSPWQEEEVASIV